MSDRVKWFLFGVLSYQVIQVCAVVITGKSFVEWGVLLHALLVE